MNTNTNHIISISTAGPLTFNIDFWTFQCLDVPGEMYSGIWAMQQFQPMREHSIHRTACTYASAYSICVLRAIEFKRVSWTDGLQSLVGDSFQRGKPTGTGDLVERPNLGPFGTVKKTDRMFWPPVKAVMDTRVWQAISETWIGLCGFSAESVQRGKN